MRLMVGRWASRHHIPLLASHPTARNRGTQHVTSMFCTMPQAAVPLGQGHTFTLNNPVHRISQSEQLQLRCWRDSMKLVRSFHKDERKWDQLTPGMGVQSSSSFSSSSPHAVNMVGEVVKLWIQRLDAAGVPEAELSTQHIVAHILGVTRNELLRPNTAMIDLTEQQLAEVDRLMKCRLERMPVPYIIGEWDFHYLTLKMVPPVFIPRQVTEQLVELTIKSIRETEASRVLEICCGSGAISLALLHSLPQLKCVAVDHSKHAVELTKANASQLGLSERLTVVLGKVTMDTRPPLPYSSYDLIVSNPPYVLRKDLMELQPEIMNYEDLRALDGGKDGLDVVKAVVQHAHHLLLPGGRLLLEVDSCHPYLLPAWIEKQELNLKLLQVHQDIHEKERFLEFIKPH